MRSHCAKFTIVSTLALKKEGCKFDSLIMYGVVEAPSTERHAPV